MSESELKMLLRDGCTPDLNCFVSKEGKYFPATLRLRADKKGVEFAFSNSPKKANKK